MELTREQITVIDKYLKNNGIKYWDLRIEMIDHIVSNMELNAQTNDFEKEFKDSLKKTGWQGNLSQVNSEGWQNVNKRYRKEYHRGFVLFFKKLNNVFIFVTCLLAFYILSEMISFTNFKRVSFFLFAAPLAVVIFQYVKAQYKKMGRSVNLDYGFSYLIMSFLTLNSFPTIFKNQTEIFQKMMWFIILPIHSLAFYSGYILYKKTILKLENIRKQLRS